MITIHDTKTDTTITREMTPEELSHAEIIAQQIKADQNKITKDMADKAALLAKLNLTADEAKLLLN
jgi:Mn-containing catalase